MRLPYMFLEFSVLVIYDFIWIRIALIMNLVKKIYCHTFRGCSKLAIPLLPYKDSKILNSLQELPQEFFNHNITKVLPVTDSFIRTLCGPLEKAAHKKLADVAYKTGVFYDKR